MKVAGKTAAFSFDPELDTILIVPLKHPVGPGGSVTAEVAFVLDLPDFWVLGAS